MSYRATTEWKCDRCGSIEQTTEQQLRSWSTARLTQPPLAAIEQDNTTNHHLCTSCTRALKQWLRSREMAVEDARA